MTPGRSYTIYQEQSSALLAPSLDRVDDVDHLFPLHDYDAELADLRERNELLLGACYRLRADVQHWRRQFGLHELANQEYRRQNDDLRRRLIRLGVQP